MDQQTFLYDVIAQLEDCLLDCDFDLSTDSVLYKKLKDLLDTVETYQESLP